MDINIVTRFNEDVENFVSTFKAFNDSIEEMRQIRSAYNKRRDLDARDVERQRKNLTFVMNDEYHTATERAEAKQKLAQLEFHSCLPTQSEQEEYHAAWKRAKKYVGDLQDCRHALEASRKAIKDAFVADELRTLKNDLSTYVHVSNKLDGFPLNL